MANRAGATAMSSESTFVRENVPQFHRERGTITEGSRAESPQEAEATGFEPADLLPGHRFSKPALSTTQPHLQRAAFSLHRVLYERKQLLPILPPFGGCPRVRGSNGILALTASLAYFRSLQQRTRPCQITNSNRKWGTRIFRRSCRPVVRWTGDNAGRIRIFYAVRAGSVRVQRRVSAA